MRQSWGLSNLPKKISVAVKVLADNVAYSWPQLLFLWVFGTWVLAKNWLPHTWVYSNFQLFWSSLRQPLYINMQVWASLENSFQISLWKQFATNGCVPAQLQQAINPVWTKFFKKFLMFFITDTNMYENVDVLRWSLSLTAWFLQTLAVNEKNLLFSLSF